ncbi:MAG: LPS export ABC transporter ATP-binding protein [candidate division FCPU426 bacterium]
MPETIFPDAQPGAVQHRFLKAEHLSKTYSGREVVRDVQLEVRQGEVVGLLGPNGAGKTTCFYMVTGLVKPDRGRVFLETKHHGTEAPGMTDLTDLPMHARAQQGVGYLAQEASIFRKLSVEENIMAILEMRPLSPAERQAKLRHLLEEFGIAHWAKQKAYTLSGGERRRTEVARALAIDPDFILLDEPFVGVDPIAVIDLQELIRSLADRNIGVLITDHNVRETLSIIDRAYLLYQGQVLLSGTAETLANSAEAKKIYLGEKFAL